MPDGLQIITNHVPRATLGWNDLTAREQRDFDYLDTDERREGATFFRYRGNVYSFDGFMRMGAGEMPDEFKGWDSYASDSFFSGVLVKIVDDGERVICGLYLS